MIAHLEAQTGRPVNCYGTKVALALVTDAVVSDKMKDEVNMYGHYGMFRGTPLMELPNNHAPGTDTFQVNDSFLLILPSGEQFCKIVLEGAPYIYETAADGSRLDEALEFFFGRLVGIAILIARNYGIYKLS